VPGANLCQNFAFAYTPSFSKGPLHFFMMREWAFLLCVKREWGFIFSVIGESTSSVLGKVVFNFFVIREICIYLHVIYEPMTFRT